MDLEKRIEVLKKDIEMHEERIKIFKKQTGCIVPRVIRVLLDRKLKLIFCENLNDNFE